MEEKELETKVEETKVEEAPVAEPAAEAKEAEKPAEAKKAEKSNYFKRLLKDPITNLEEANARKKALLPWLIGFGVATVLFFALGALHWAITIVGVVALAGLAYFGLLFFVSIKAKEKFKGLTCNKCNELAVINTKELFDKYIKSEIVPEEAKITRNFISEPNNGYVDITIEASGAGYALIDLTCPKCGEVKHLRYVFDRLFSIVATKTKVPVLSAKEVAADLLKDVNEVLEQYNDPAHSAEIPYSIHSQLNPLFEQRTTFKAANSMEARPKYHNVKIDTHVEGSDLVEQYFLFNQISGKLGEIKDK